MKNQKKPIGAQIEIMERCLNKFGDYQGKRTRKLQQLRAAKK